MEDIEYKETRETLVSHFQAFKRLEQDEPELAQKLGFTGFLLYDSLQIIGNEQRELLEQIADNPPQVLSSELGKIRNLLENNILPHLENR